MIVNLPQIGEQGAEYSFSLVQEQLERLEERFSVKAFQCQATIRRTNDRLVCDGHLNVDMSTECDNCLVPVSIPIEESFTLFLLPEVEIDHTESEIEVPAGSEDIYYYQNEKVDLALLFEEQLMFEIPLTIHCSENCKGLCSQCGTNLNQSTCDCEPAGNRPFAILGNIKPN